MECRPWTHFRLLAASYLFWKIPALAKLLMGPIDRLSVEEELSAYLMLIVGKRVRPGRLIFASPGTKDWLVLEKALCRINPRRCSTVKLEVTAVVLSREKVWLPAFMVCGKPSNWLSANGVLLGSRWK